MKKALSILLALFMLIGALPTLAEETEITVNLSIKTDTEIWLPSYQVTIAENSTVKEVLEEVLAQNENIEAIGMEEGYVQGFIKDGETLSQMDKGPLSGWGYKVNGEMPSVPFTDYKVEDGDEILWYYTVDFTLEFEEPPSLPFKDTQNHWATEAIFWAYEKDIMQGVSEEEFAPEFPLSRGMLVTILYRLEGSPAHKGINPFEDVGEDAWYYDAVLWANEVGIVTGVSEEYFFPDSSITRQDFAVILHRYAIYKGMDVSVGEDTNILSYEDAFSVSEYAIPAIEWTAGAGIMSGRSESTLNPQETATRAEAATILMRFLGE